MIDNVVREMLMRAAEKLREAGLIFTDVIDHIDGVTPPAPAPPLDDSQRAMLRNLDLLFDEVSTQVDLPNGVELIDATDPTAARGAANIIPGPWGVPGDEDVQDDDEEDEVTAEWPGFDG